MAPAARPADELPPIKPGAPELVPGEVPNWPGYDAVEVGVEDPLGGVIVDLGGLATLLAIALGVCLVAGLVGVVVSVLAAILLASGSRPENQLGIFQPLMLLQPVEQLNTATETNKLVRTKDLPQDFILVILYRFTLPPRAAYKPSLACTPLLISNSVGLTQPQCLANR